MDAPDYFIPDRDGPVFYPLRGYLRGVPASVAEKYIDALTAPGDLVIDPFACAPTVARVALRMGRRAIAVESNPLWEWLARTMATLPAAPEIDAALARLGDTLKDDAPLRAHIAQLYVTTCAACHQPTPAEYFVHARSGGPIQRHYVCTHCNETRDDPATEEDYKRAGAFEAHAMHYHLAFERLVPPDNLHAERIRKLLAVYTPRNLYALVTLTLKIDSLFHSTREHEIMLLLLLHLLDRGTCFYASVDAAPQLSAHKQFIEFNLWREIEIAAHQLGRAGGAFVLAESAREVVDSPSPSAFVGRGSARTLARALPSGSAALVLAAPPTRRIAVWALSYFWGAWILGRQAALPLAPFLDSKKDAVWERRWYFDSLVQSMTAMLKPLRSGARLALAFDESWHQAIEAVLLAAAGGRFELETFLFQPGLDDLPRREYDDIRGEYRMTFVLTPTLALPRQEQGREIKGQNEQGRELEEQIRATAFQAGADILRRRGEPLAFSWVHHAVYTRVMRGGLLTEAMGLKSKIPPGRFVHKAVLAGLSEGYAHDFDHYESPSQFVWLRRIPEGPGAPSPLDPPLIDRVENAVRELLQQNAPVARADLEDAVYRQFPGDLTPEAGLVELCARAYADESNGAWIWRARDSAGEKARALDLLAHLGERLGYAVARDEAPFDLVWKSDGEIAHGFIWRNQAQFADMARVQVAPARGYLVVPDACVALLRAKTRRQPQLADAFNEAGWDFVRVPAVETLSRAEKIERNDVALMAGLVPPVAEERAQLELF